MSSFTKRFFKDSVIYSLQPFLTKTVSYFLVPLYTTYLSPSDFGNLNYVLAIGSFFRAFVEMGLYTSFWKYKTKESGYQINEVIYNINAVQFLIAFNILLIAFILKNILFNKSVLGYLILVYLLSQTVFIIFQSSNLVFRARFQAKKYLFATVFSTVLILSLNVLFVAFLKLNFQGVIYSYLAGYAILSILYFRVPGKNYGKPINRSLIKEMIYYGFPIMIGNIASLFITIASRFFLKELSTDNELGLFSYGYKFGELYHLILANTFFMAWNALRWEIYEAHNGKQIFAKFYKYVLIAFPLIGFILIPILYGLASLMTVNNSFLKGLQIIPIVVFGFVFQSFYYFNAMGLLFKAKTKRIMLIIIIGACVSIILNLLLIGKLGMYGASISTFITYLLMFIICRYYSNKVYEIERNVKMEISQIFLIIVSMILYFLFLKITTNLLLIFIFGIGLAAIIIIIYFMIGIMQLSELKGLIFQLITKKKK